MTSQQVRGADSEQDDDDSGCAGFSNSSSDDGADSKNSPETSDVGQFAVNSVQFYADHFFRILNICCLPSVVNVRLKIPNINTDLKRRP